MPIDVPEFDVTHVVDKTTFEDRYFCPFDSNHKNVYYRNDAHVYKCSQSPWGKKLLKKGTIVRCRNNHLHVLHKNALEEHLEYNCDSKPSLETPVIYNKYLDQSNDLGGVYWDDDDDTVQNQQQSGANNSCELEASNEAHKNSSSTNNDNILSEITNKVEISPSNKSNLSFNLESSSNTLSPNSSNKPHPHCSSTPNTPSGDRWKADSNSARITSTPKCEDNQRTNFRFSLESLNINDTSNKKVEQENLNPTVYIPVGLSGAIPKTKKKKKKSKKSKVDSPQNSDRKEENPNISSPYPTQSQKGNQTEEKWTKVHKKK